MQSNLRPFFHLFNVNKKIKQQKFLQANAIKLCVAHWSKNQNYIIEQLGDVSVTICYTTWGYTTVKHQENLLALPFLDEK